MQDELIREIISTFELPRRIEDRILFKAISSDEFLSFASYSEKYRYISGLVDKYTQRYDLMFALSLDAPVSRGG